ncbi:hypothetical protein [Deinococcus cellulosilyticus]|uniref:Uncharacterized protein n=1 Tax=Deinococcus cellulosilyticus (strain DSM 18568 / NBRC 106333 / KACC 11606 / 5516J-15) TaxID=1223518 RepID=A0A511NAB8_DEIC1|nr:hypothetical protein [Deinococcus cellulosilyticus]GEM49775.1 hypothetical protein DC3_54100 [Deinococcus cellulosilyticus NBRC 106333 = KACC 11606]
MNKTVALQFLSAFFGLMLLGVVLIVAQLTLLRTSKASRWQRICEEKGWTLKHHPTFRPPWQVTSPHWTVWFHEPLSEDQPTRLVFEAPLPVQGIRLLMVHEDQYQWPTDPQAVANLQNIYPEVVPLEVVELQTRVGRFMVHLHPEALRQDALGALRGVLETLSSQKVQVVVNENDNVQIVMLDVEWEKPQVFGLIHGGEALITLLRGLEAGKM